MRGEGPSGWLRARYCDVAAVNGKSLKGSTKPDTPIKYLDIAGVPSPGVLGEVQDMVFGEAPSRARRVVRSGDTLVSMVRPYLRSFAFIPNAAQGLIASTGFAVLTPKAGVAPSFLYQTVLTDGFLRFLEERMTGSNYPAVNASDVAEAPLLLPPLPEQKKIAAILSSVDEAIAATQAVIEQTRRVKEGLLQDLLTRGIGHTRFKQTEIGEIPEGWEVVGIKGLFQRLRVPRAHDRTSRSETGSAPILDQSAREWFGFHEGEADIAASNIAPLVTFANHTCAVRFMTEPFSVIQNVFPLRALGDVHPRFLFWTMSGAVRQAGYRGHWPEVKRCMFAKPPLSEQGEIVSRLDAMEDCESKNHDTLTRLQSSKSGLLQDLLTGKIRVSP